MQMTTSMAGYTTTLFAYLGLLLPPVPSQFIKYLLMSTPYDINGSITSTTTAHHFTVMPMTGLIGINRQTPNAQLHIVPKQGKKALLVEDEQTDEAIPLAHLYGNTNNMLSFTRKAPNNDAWAEHHR